MNWLPDPPWLLPALAYAVASVVAFALFGWDKTAARRGRPRINERTLHAVTLAGGFLGAWSAQRVFRHKTRKRTFACVTFLAALLHGALWYVLLS